MSAPEHIFRIGLRDTSEPRAPRSHRSGCGARDRSGLSRHRSHRCQCRAPSGGKSLPGALSLRSRCCLWAPMASRRLPTGLPPLSRRASNGGSAPQRICRSGPCSTRSRRSRPFECGSAGIEKAGEAAFEKLMSRLRTAAGIGIPLQAAVIRRDEANAIALPGGHIYVFKGLIDQARNVDEVAGVIAHEAWPCGTSGRHPCHSAGVRPVAGLRHDAG